MFAKGQDLIEISRGLTKKRRYYSRQLHLSYGITKP